ncbi:MAG: hypothetical protein LC808_39910, partial [Actinobacteria bacterium]|nr:hypothetical protein [Actinomycetota bacterium]
PGLAWAALLIFLLAIGEFSVPMYLRYDVFPVEILTQFSAFYDFGAATAAAVPLALLTVALLVVEGRFLSPTRLSVRGFLGETEGSMIRLGAAHIGWLFGVHHGDKMEGYLNGKKYLEVSDDTFTGPGGVGLWTKADAASSFDDLRVLPASRA